MNIPKYLVLVQVYWLSLIPIGYALMMIAFGLFKKGTDLELFAKMISRQNVIVKIVASFTVINLIFALFSGLFYVFHAPPKVAPILYLFLLIISAGYYALVIGRSLMKVHDGDILEVNRETNLTKLTVYLAGLMLLFDYIFSLHVMSNSGGDAIFHMSRVLDILNNGFNVSASYMSNLRESAYHYNVIYAFYVTPSKLFHLQPMEVWQYSISFFRLMLWLSIAAFAEYTFKRWFSINMPKMAYVALAIIAAVSSTSGYFFVATYPNQIVYIWMIVYIIILDYFYRPSKIQAVLLTSVSLIATMTHPTYALALASFTGLYLVTRLLFEKEKLKIIRGYRYFIPPIGTLLIGPVISKLVPSRITQTQLHLMDPVMVNLGPIKFINPGQDMPVDLVGWVLFLAGTIATVWVLFILWRKRHWPLAFSLVAFYPLVAYTPVFSLINILLPTWLIQRFSSVNLLFYLYVPLALIAILNFICKWQKIGDRLRRIGNYQLVITLMVLVASAVVVVPAYKMFDRYQYMNAAMYPYQTTINASFGDILTDGKIVLTNQAHGYLLTGTFPIDVVAVEEGHSPISADTVARIHCQNILLDTFSFDGLKAAKVDYIVFPTSPEGKTETERKKAESKPYVRLLANGPFYYVYSFNKNFDYTGVPSDQVNVAPCKEYFGVEK